MSEKHLPFRISCGGFLAVRCLFFAAPCHYRGSAYNAFLWCKHLGIIGRGVVCYPLSRFNIIFLFLCASLRNQTEKLPQDA